ncbi:MAG: porin [Sulfuriferula sp.]|nr:porin [Sulfuriferula sp.]
MNKKLIALAIAAAVSAPAMAATSNVEVYGLMSVGVDSVTNGSGVAGNTSTSSVGRVTDYASRLGFKGTEDLGNGLSAVWQIESALAVDGGSSTNAASGGIGGSTGALGGGTLRNTFVGLSSKDAGTGLLGKIDTPYKTATGRLDQFADTLGDYNSLMGAASQSGAYSGYNSAGNYFDLRPANVVAYASPNFSGFSAVGAYVFGAESATTGTSNKGNAYSLAAMYDAGPLYLTAAYEKHNLGDAGSGSLAAANLDRKAWKLGASYSIMDFTLAAIYEKTDDNMGTGGVNLYGHRTWFLSGKYKMGATSLIAQYANAGSDDELHSGATGNTGAKAYTVGATYDFSKRTKVYALYTKINNDTYALYNYGAGGSSPAAGAVAGDSLGGFSLQMKHSF